MSDSSKPSILVQQGRWAWWCLPLVALGSLYFLWVSLGVIDEAEWQTRAALFERAPEWSLIHAFTGRTLGR